MAKEDGLTTRPALAASARMTTTTTNNLAAREEPTINIGIRKPILAVSAGNNNISSCADTTMKTKAMVGSDIRVSSSSISSSAALSKRASFGIGIGNTAQSFDSTANAGKRKATATTSPAAFATKKTRPLDHAAHKSSPYPGRHPRLPLGCPGYVYT